jgi:hypothetical protein
MFRFKIAPGTQRLIPCRVAVDHDLLSLADNPGLSESGVEDSLTAASANRFHFLKRMRDLHQTLTAGKSPGAKVRSDTEGHHRYLI